ncbi:MAG TPA: LacI family DNA-binding transcriptional regulator [Propionibacteriaceae bacterium]|nr:LacI family DNA-binding transcriptional regulator [Propionibacteriaceae bacterium]
MKPANLHDVARRAGVSHQTVSRVINGHPSLRPETRERVLAAVAELGYRPNKTARTLATRTSMTLGLVSSGDPNYGPSSTMTGFTTACRDFGYAVQVATVPQIDASSLPNAVGDLVGRGVDGVVVVAARASELASSREVAIAQPLVVVTSGEAQSLATVSVDQAVGAALAARHLVDHGHRSIVHLAGADDFIDAAARRQGWESALSLAGLEVRTPLVGDWSARSGYQLGCRLVQDLAFTAVFSGNDQMALGLIHAFSDAGIAVPGDVSVVGFDDIPEAEHFLPPLTTIRQDFAEVGRQTMSLMLSLLSGEAPRAVSIPPQLVSRQSVAPAPLGVRG